MAGLEGLSHELFTSILSHIPSQRDLNNLSQTSRTLYHRTVPVLYHSWSYHGLAQNPSDTRPWRKFLETINWRPDLGAHVKELDLREWGKCPRLEEYVGCFWEGYDEREAVKKERLRERSKGTVGEERGFWEDESDEGNEGWVEEGSESDDTDEEDDEYEYLEGEDIEESELAFLGPSPAESVSNLDAMFLKAGAEMGFERAETVLKYANILCEKDEDWLMVMLLSKVPNVRKVCMVLPEDTGWDLELNVLHRFVQDTEGLKAAGILQQLETLYICSPLHLGGKDHREYTLDIKRVFPFMRLPKLKNLFTLTAHFYNDPANFPPINYTPLIGTSPLTTLVYDEAELPCHDAIASLSIPTSLQHFRWTGEITCFSIGTCYAPFQAKLGDALRKHQHSLESLHLDIRHNFCHEPGHHANPHANLAEIKRFYKDAFATQWERERGAKNAVLIGSLGGFTALRRLAIHVTSLVGHQKWAESETSLVDLLPARLEDLTLFIAVHSGGEHERRFENRLWYSECLNLVRGAAVKLPGLRTIAWRLVDRAEDRRRELAGAEAVAETRTQKTDDDDDDDARLVDPLFIEVRQACVDAGIKLDIEKASPHGETGIPYFVEQTRDRNPGRDF